MELSTSVSTASIFEIVLGAPLVVKFVMALLVFLSIWTWAIIVSKILLISRATREAAAFESSFWSGGNLDELYEKVGQNPKDPMQAVFAAGMREWRRTPAGLPSGSALSIAQRIDRAMMLTVARELGRMETQMIVLASIGTAAPFIGLFGTVWGVMNSFLGIAAAGNTTWVRTEVRHGDGVHVVNDHAAAIQRGRGGWEGSHRRRQGREGGARWLKHMRLRRVS